MSDYDMSLRELIKNAVREELTLYTARFNELAASHVTESIGRALNLLTTHYPVESPPSSENENRGKLVATPPTLELKGPKKKPGPKPGFKHNTVTASDLARAASIPPYRIWYAARKHEIDTFRKGGALHVYKNAKLEAWLEKPVRASKASKNKSKAKAKSITITQEQEQETQEQ